ncbi:MAG: hypothetical protein FWC28_08115 [Proteobacteria bacterium]|nr:hypothetical protein [Cystobacterineae bacterium]MCL2258464.1 hypothetical protein [Cystobacterineae bacterium]MCL2315196.1 hypothetical protein [Pseudomonadota bacterium]
MLRSPSLRLLLVTLPCLLLHACLLEELSPKWKLDKLRVLGMSASPAALQPGESTLLSALVVDEPQNRPLTYLWLGCSADPHNQNRSPCSDSEILKTPSLLLNEQGKPLENIQFLGFGPQALYTVPPSLFEALPENHPQRKIGTLGMVLLMVVAEALPPIPSPEDVALLIQRAQDKLVDSQTTLFRIPVRESEQTPNQNPIISHLLVDGQPQDNSSPLPLKKGKTYGLDMAVPQESFEEYAETTGVGTTQKTETLFASFFTTCGELEDSFFNLATSTRPKLSSPDGKDIEPCPATPVQKLFVVLRDSRGGQSWQELSFIIQE